MRLIIVSGRSGSGKSTALDVLEDNGFYCIDNLPAGLLPELAERALLHTELLHPQVAVSIDARNLPSIALAEKLGFKREGCLREHEMTHSGLCDLLIYGLLRKEWESAKA